MPEINPNEVYTTAEVQRALKVSNSTIKRLLKRGILRANKVGGQYRVLGKELLRLVSPQIERKAVGAYQKLKKKIKSKVKNW
ncbi:MAG: helix-turn-helix domain-containing protein [Patescibacteria group bacterium]